MGSKRERNRKKPATEARPVKVRPAVSSDARYQVRWTAVIAVISTGLVMLLGGWSVKSCADANRFEREVAGEYTMPAQAQRAIGRRVSKQYADANPSSALANEIPALFLSHDGRATLTWLGVTSQGFFKADETHVQLSFDNPEQMNKDTSTALRLRHRELRQFEVSLDNPGGIPLMRTAHPGRLLIPLQWGTQSVEYDQDIYVERK